MNKTDTPQTHFSIYKINTEAIGKVDKIDSQIEYNNAEIIIERIISTLYVKIKNKPNCDFIRKVKYSSLSGLIFKTVHDPMWKELAIMIINNNEINTTNRIKSTSTDEDMKYIIANSNVSYILLQPVDNKVYALTGGYGSKYIHDFIQKNYGIYLIPKLLTKDRAVIKNISEIKPQGIYSSTERTNKNATSFTIEQDISSIFKKLRLEIDSEIAKKLKIPLSNEENKKVNIINKDSIVIKRSLSINEVIDIINNLPLVENLPDYFPINYWVSIEKKGMKNKDLNNELYTFLIDNSDYNFIIVGNEYEDYIVDANKYIVTNEHNQIEICKSEEITFSELMKHAKDKKDKLSKTYIETVLNKWKLSTYDNAGNYILYNMKVMDSINGFLEYGESKIPCYLINGSWYVLDSNYYDFLSEEYKQFLINNKNYVSKIQNTFDLSVHECKNEDDYNLSLNNRDNIVCTHRVIMDNIELADAIFWDNDHVYFMHNKMDFDGKNVRDLNNQILASAKYLNKVLISINRDNILTSYYNKIVNKYSNNKTINNLTVDGFKEIIISSRKKCFIAGYINAEFEVTTSYYAKFLTVDINRKLAPDGFHFILYKIT